MVTSPHELALLDTGRSVDMLREETRHRVLGRVENMAQLTCPHCGERIDVHSKDYVKRQAAAALEVLGSLPLDPAHAEPIGGYRPSALPSVPARRLLLVAAYGPAHPRRPRTAGR